jgi:hypothetical protein
MLNKVKEYAMIKFANDAKAQEEFVEGFVKESNDFRKYLTKEPTRGTTPSIAEEMARGVSGALGKGIGGLAVALGATSVGTLYGHAKNMNLHSKFLQALEHAVSNNSILKEAKREKVLQYAESIFKFAPNVSTDPNILTSILANAVLGDGMDIMTMKTLTDLEDKYTSNNTFSPKTYV